MLNPDWENLKELFHAALALPPAERSSYLDRACKGDASLRHAVQVLIKSHEDTNLMDEPAYQAAAEMLVDRIDLEPDQMVAQYRIVSLLGEGGMGKVYLAEDTKLHRRIAMKFLPPDSAANEQANRRLLREAQAAAKLDHPNICAVHEVGEVDGRCFIVMPYVAGETLYSRMKNNSLDLPESVAIAAQVADALYEAHEQGIIHRDIKPANIIITPRGQAKVMDFGLARTSPTHAAVDAEASTQVQVTTPGTIIGTVPYMSPEQVHGQQLDARTDIFSFGAVLFEMLTGVQPFTAESPAGIISAILTKEPARLNEYVVGCPAALQSIVDKCLEKDRKQRYQTMRDVADDLENVRPACAGVTAQRHITKRAETQPEKIETGASQLRSTANQASRIRPRLVGFALVVLLIAVISGYALFFRKGSTGSNLKSAGSSAHDLYLRGRVKLNSEGRENNEEAIKVLEQAVAADPNFAPAYAELARAYNIRAFYFATGDERKKLAEDAEVNVEKSLALNPELPEGHFARGLILWTHDNHFPHEQAINSYKRALSLNPNLDEVHHQLALVYLHIGLLDKGWAEIEKALAINPANTMARFRLGVINLYRADYDDALTVFKSTPLEKTPSLVAFQTATALFQLGRIEEAEAITDDYVAKYPKDEGGVGTSVKAMILAKRGKDREAEEAIQHAIEIGTGFSHFHHAAYNIASAYALMNKPEQAIKWLQDAADDGFPCYPLFEKDANLNSLRKDERFIAFMAKQKQQWEKYKSSL